MTAVEFEGLAEYVERAMRAGGRSDDEIENALAALVAEASATVCPACGWHGSSFRPDRPGRLTFYCCACGNEGPADRLHLLRDVLRDIQTLDAITP